ncbi:MAG: hypothetical protein JW955_07295 [Sedimentisphaerales bacterium]|nr:hypothetical protein [Sedimentisphaerales bacterium]
MVVRRICWTCVCSPQVTVAASNFGSTHLNRRRREEQANRQIEVWFGSTATGLDGTR